MDAIIRHVLQHAFLIAKRVVNCIPSQVNLAESGVYDCAGNEQSFFHRRSGMRKVGVLQGHFELSCLGGDKVAVVIIEVMH